MRPALHETQWADSNASLSRDCAPDSGHKGRPIPCQVCHKASLIRRCGCVTPRLRTRRRLMRSRRSRRRRRSARRKLHEVNLDDAEEVRALTHKAAVSASYAFRSGPAALRADASEMAALTRAPPQEVHESRLIRLRRLRSGHFCGWGVGHRIPRHLWRRSVSQSRTTAAPQHERAAQAP
jgi:hypothetical protein